jgi:hypothetical protein
MGEWLQLHLGLNAESIAINTQPLILLILTWPGNLIRTLKSRS